MAFQTSVSTLPDALVAGMRPNPGTPSDVISKAADTAEVINYGRACARGATANACIVPAQASDVTTKFLGFALCDTSRQADATYNGAYQATEAVPILRRGRIAVDCIASSWAYDGKVYIYTASGANRGKVSTGTEGGDATILRGARFVNVGSAAGVAVIEFEPLVEVDTDT